MGCYSATCLIFTYIFIVHCYDPYFWFISVTSVLQDLGCCVWEWGRHRMAYSLQFWCIYRNMLIEFLENAAPQSALHFSLFVSSLGQILGQNFIFYVAMLG